MESRCVGMKSVHPKVRCEVLTIQSSFGLAPAPLSPVPQCQAHKAFAILEDDMMLP